MYPVTEKLAQFSSALRFEDLPAEVSERASLLFMDLLGISIRSQTLDSTLALEQGLRDLGLSDGICRVPGNTDTWTPFGAALLGAAAAHSLDFDDTHAKSLLHPGAPVIPAALAAAQMAGVTTRELLAGIVAGYEVMIRVAYGVNPTKHSERGFHLTATTGVFGAVAAAGNILKLTPEQMGHAFGTALSESAAAVLARNNYTGATQAFEGREGFFNAYSPEPNPEAALAGLGEVWEIMSSGVKPYPCCRGIHAPLDAVFKLLSKHQIDVRNI